MGEMVLDRVLAWRQLWHRPTTLCIGVNSAKADHLASLAKWSNGDQMVARRTRPYVRATRAGRPFCSRCWLAPASRHSLATVSVPDAGSVSALRVACHESRHPGVGSSWWRFLLDFSTAFPCLGVALILSAFRVTSGFRVTPS